MKTDNNTDIETNIKNNFSLEDKIVWEKPELEICQLSQTLAAGGSGGDGGGQTT